MRWFTILMFLLAPALARAAGDSYWSELAGSARAAGERGSSSITSRPEPAPNPAQPSANERAQAELARDTRYYVDELRARGVLLEAPALERTLAATLARVHPGAANGEPPRPLSLRLLRTNVPAAHALGDGTLLVSAGLLAMLRDSSELAAVFAHQAAHLELGHDAFEGPAHFMRRRADWLTGLVAWASGEAADEEDAHRAPAARPTLASGEMLRARLVSRRALALVGALRTGSEARAADAATLGWLRASGGDERAWSRVLARAQGRARDVLGHEEASLADEPRELDKRLRRLPPPGALADAADPGYEASVLAPLRAALATPSEP